MQYIFGLLLIFVLSVLYYTRDAPIQIPPMEGRPETVQLVKNSWEKLLAQCPGLNKYQNDMAFIGMNDLIDPDMGDMSRVEVMFKISETPSRIPDNFRAWGHTCGYGISPGAVTIRIQKRMCVSVCLGSEYTGPLDFVSDL